jgi:hypothetical protein
MRKRALIAVTTLALGTVMVMAGGAGASSTGPKKIDLSSTEAINSYLLSHGVDPASVVTQRGLNNYAGPSCPGAGWNCTTSTQVVQIAQGGGQNEFVCEPEDAQVTATEDPAVCVLVQTDAARNQAECRERITTDEPLVTQLCDITQEGERNTAIVEQFIYQTGPAMQDASQRALVEQIATESDDDQNAPQKNELHLSQTIQQFTNVGTMQTQDAHQFTDVLQNASGTVGNFAHTHQEQDQQMTGAATTQMQNTDPDEGFDCAPFRAPEAPHICANIDQTADDSINNAQIHQALRERMSTNVIPTLQQQGIDVDTEGVAGGLEGEKPQRILGTDGTNQAAAHQRKRLHVSAPPGSPDALQFDEARCCGLSASGGHHSTEQVTQHAALSAPDGAIQSIELLGETNAFPFDSSANCHVNQTGRINDAHSSGSAQDSGESCTVVLETDCDSAAGELEEPTCTTTDVGVDSLADSTALLTIFPATPTSGLPLDLDIFGEPSDYTGPVLP